MDTERRIGSDRRRRPTPAFSRYSLWGGRRRGCRRGSDARAIYVDQFGLGLSILLTLTFLFHVLDAMFTLGHIARGGAELNPAMAYFLRYGPGAFLGVKLGTAAIGLWFLAVHSRFPYVRQGITALFFLYAGVVCYHFVLIWNSGAGL